MVQDSCYGQQALAMAVRRQTLPIKLSFPEVLIERMGQILPMSPSNGVCCVQVRSHESRFPRRAREARTFAAPDLADIIAAYRGWNPCLRVSESTP